MLRQFHVEGFVTRTSRSRAAVTKIMFASEAIEDIRAGWRARETYIVHGSDEFEEVFEPAAPGKAFAVLACAAPAREVAGAVALQSTGSGR